MHILVSSLNASGWLPGILAAQPGFTVSALHAAHIDLGDFGYSRPQPRPDMPYVLYTLPVFPRRPYPYSRYTRGLRALLKRLAPDVIYHIGEPSELSTAQLVHVARRVCPAARIILYSFENLNRQWQGFPQSLRARAERATLPQVDLIAACTHGAEAALVGAGFPAERIRVVYAGTAPEQFHPSPDPVLRADLCPPDGFLIGYVGRLVPEKGVDVLLRALAALPAECVLCAIGSGRGADELQALSEQLGVADRVRWLGRLGHDLLPRYLSTCDALVLPSRSLPTWQEQYGAVLVEGMLCGTAVVGSSSGAIPEIIQDAGLIFPEDDAAALAERLDSLHQDPALRALLGRRGRERAAREFTTEKHLARLMALFREVLTRPRR
jgi:glycosyltransferase involved in cell wall biosynthesis